VLFYETGPAGRRLGLCQTTQPKNKMKMLKLIPLIVVTLVGVASVSSAEARPCSNVLIYRPTVVFVGRYIAPSRPLSLFTLGTTLAGPSRCITPVVFHSVRRY